MRLAEDNLLKKKFCQFNVNGRIWPVTVKIFAQEETWADVLSMTSVFFEISKLKYFLCNRLTVFSQLF